LPRRERRKTKREREGERERERERRRERERLIDESLSNTTTPIHLGCHKNKTSFISTAISH